MVSARPSPRSPSAQPPFGVAVAGNDWTALDDVEPPTPRSVSVVVIHHEQEPELTRTLAALRAQTHPADRLEVIVVDDGSRVAPPVGPGARLVRQARDGARRSAARNRGVAESTGELLVFLDADTVPEPAFVQRLARLPSLAPEAVVVGARRHTDLRKVALDADIATAGPAHELPAPGWLRDGYRATENLRRSGSGAFRYVISAVLGCTRWLFDEAGGFDEGFDRYGGEDWEWAHRAWQAGAVFAHVPEAVAWHDGPDWGHRADPGRRRAEKNAEAIRLAGLIDAWPLRPHGLLVGRPELEATLPAGVSVAAAFVCVDSLLAAVPGARVRVADGLRPAFGGDPRVVALDDSGDGAPLGLELLEPVAFDRDGLRELCDEMLAADLGACRLHADNGTGAAGRPVGRITSRRHGVRIARWGADGGLPEIERRVDWVRRLADEPGGTGGPGGPDVEAYLGGWERRPG